MNHINHIALVLDASSSMEPHAKALVKVADNQIVYLARRSKELDQETRITVYMFNYAHNIECLIYDKDVLRMPSIAELYHTQGYTALRDATSLVLSDLALTPEKYGEHAFLIYVLTDGEENDSRKVGTQELRNQIESLPDHWTLAVFVPNPRNIAEVKSFGFLKDNIAVWDTTTDEGISEVGERIRQTTEVWMGNRTQGIRGTKNLFQLKPVDTSDMESQLEFLNFGQFRVLDVKDTGRLDEFVEASTKRSYKRGEAYYQLTKPEMIQKSKDIVILSKKGAYTGANARKLLGLPDANIKVAPSKFPYEIYVQSLSMNRKLMGGTKLLIL